MSLTEKQEAALASLRRHADSKAEGWVEAREVHNDLIDAGLASRYSGSSGTGILLSNLAKKDVVERRFVEEMASFEYRPKGWPNENEEER